MTQSLKPNDALAVVAMNLSHAAPSEWDEFLKALGAYTQQAKDDLLRAPAEALQKAQGSAQQADRTYELLSTCQQQASRIFTNQRK